MEIGTRNRYVFQTPFYATWCVSNLCNANCMHCSSNAGRKLLNELTTDEAYDMLEQLARAGVFSIGISGGEPLLRSDIFDLIEYAHNLKLSIGLGTNGLMFDELKAKNLARLGVDRVQVSIDGATPHTHDGFRGVKGLFSKALEALNTCRKSGLRTQVCFTPTRYNFRELTDVIDLSFKLEVGGFNLSQFVPTGRGDKELDLSADEWRQVLHVWINKKQQYEGKMRFDAHEAQLVLVDPTLAEVPGFVGCQAANALCCITADGFVTPCVMMDLKVGNIRESSFKDIWTNSTDLINLRNRDLLKGKCQTCKHRDLCGGCRAVPYAYSGDYLDEDPRCWYNPIKGDIQ